MGTMLMSQIPALQASAEPDNTARYQDGIFSVPDLRGSRSGSRRECWMGRPLLKNFSIEPQPQKGGDHLVR